MKLVEPIPPHLRPWHVFLLRRNIKKRDHRHDEAAHLRQQAQEMERRGNTSSAQKLYQKAQQNEREERALTEKISEHFRHY